MRFCLLGVWDDVELSVFARARTEQNGMPSLRSYRSARMNQNANPPVLCAGAPTAWDARTPSEPLRPVFRHPRRSMIMRTKTPIACRNRAFRRT